MATVLRTDQAEEDLIEILASLAQGGSSASARFDALLSRKLELHSRFPGLGAPCDEIAPGLRTFTVWRYLIFYEELVDGILIVRVMHGARDIPNSFS